MTAGHARRPPVLPLFVVGFIAVMAVATAGVVPAAQPARIKVLQQFLLTTATFALGLGVHVKSLMRLGLRPVLLGLCSTLVILAVVLVGIILGAGARVRPDTPRGRPASGSRSGRATRRRDGRCRRLP